MNVILHFEWERFEAWVWDAGMEIKSYISVVVSFTGSGTQDAIRNSDGANT